MSGKLGAAEIGFVTAFRLLAVLNINDITGWFLQLIFAPFDYVVYVSLYRRLLTTVAIIFKARGSAGFSGSGD